MVQQAAIVMLLLLLWMPESAHTSGMSQRRRIAASHGGAADQLTSRTSRRHANQRLNHFTVPSQITDTQTATMLQCSKYGDKNQKVFRIGMCELMKGIVLLNDPPRKTATNNML